MNKWGLYILSAIMGITLFSNCSSTPDEVLPQEKMAQLLADIHIGESIVDAERTKYYNDSLKKTVKQSILIKHGVSQAQLDTSFAWYGHNIEEYIAVYDRVIEILDNDIKALGYSKDEQLNISFEGDSVNTWQGVNHYSFNINTPSEFISFNLSKDRYWENGDYYTWRLKLANNISQIKWGIAADYNDGSSEFINAKISNEGWNEITLITDSTKTLNRVYGYIHAKAIDNENIYLDSLSLVRQRVNSTIYRQRFTQKTFEIKKEQEQLESDEESPSAIKDIEDDENESLFGVKRRKALKKNDK